MTRGNASGQEAYSTRVLVIARNLAVNLYRDGGFNNMAQAQQKYRFRLEQILSLFRLK